MRYAIQRRRLAADEVWEALYAFDRDGLLAKKAKKVVRYLRVAAASSPGRHVTLSTRLYEDDRAGTVLQRLNRWVDAGYLALDDRLQRGGSITLKVTAGGEELTGQMIRDALRSTRRWREHKEEMVGQVRRVLAASSPAHRRVRLLDAFEDVGSPGTWRVPAGVPAWLRK